MANERITIDLSGTEDATKGSGEFTPLPKKWYRGFLYKVTDEKTKTGANKGAPYYKARFDVAEEGDYFKRVVFDNYIGLSGKATWKIEQLARISGVWDGEDRSKVVVPTSEELTALEVEAYVKQERDEYAEEKYEDETGESPDEPIFKNVISGYRPVGGWPRPGEEKPAAKAKKGSGKITL